MHEDVYGTIGYVRRRVHYGHQKRNVVPGIVLIYSLDFPY